MGGINVGFNFALTSSFLGDRRRRSWTASAAFMCGLCLSPNGASAQTSVSQFYNGKTISMIIGAAPGGGYDAYGRLVAQFMGRHVPGRPNFVDQNMPGAGSISAAAYVANVALKDGTAIAGLHPIAITEPLLGKKSKIGYNPEKMFYLGSASSESDLCAVRKDSSIRTFSDLKDHVGLFGASAQTSSTYQSAAFLAHVLGVHIKIVSGYTGTHEILLAMERKEIDGLCGFGWSSMLDEAPQWRSTLRPIIQEGVRGFAPLDALKVPVAISFATKDEQRQAMRLYYSQELLGRPFMIAPETPRDRRTALRQAFLDTLHDPALLAEAERRKLGITPTSGADVQKLVQKFYNAPQAIVKDVRAAIGSR